MRIGAFEVKEPIPELNEPYLFAILRPWIDVNNVGSLVLNELETQYGAMELARLAKPGHFFDFTRYRPTLYYEEGIRRLSIPNMTLRYAKRGGENDLLFFHLLEPHALSEVYVDSVLRLLKTLKVKKYILLGSMYDVVPHTRPLIINGGAIGRETQQDLKRSEAQPSHYQGPTSITTLITQRAAEFDIETIWFIVSLPQYVVLEEDYIGKVRLMEILNLLYNIPVNQKDFEKALEQRSLISQKVERTPELKNLLPQLETMYEVRTNTKEGERRPQLSSEIEGILWKITGKDLGKA
ncbi:MAG TPA: PAC2 family protein [Thermodesulfobacteriota bacterium]|nr:PAC2 family protein [Thermodesulfobacteriota bacterium]